MARTPAAARPRAAVRALAAASAAALATLLTTPVAEASPPGTKDVTADLFEWRFDSVARECRDTLGPAGYGLLTATLGPNTALAVHIGARSCG